MTIPPEGPEGLDPITPAPATARGASGRAASVTLRAGGDEGGTISEAMDPATRSLADALKITYRLLMLAMIALVVIFAASGVESVKLGERAVRLVFGKVVDDDLGPGFRFSFPTPIGELVKVPTSAAQIDLDDAFWPALSDEEKKMPVENLGGTGSNFLDPERDGSLITADGNIVHAKWSIKYQRSSPREWAQTLDEKTEAKMVVAAAKRGILHAAATMTIDEILRNTPDPSRPNGQMPSIEGLALREAQATLDEMKCGVRIEQLVMTQKMPPRFIAKDFLNVSAREQVRGQQIEQANTARRTRLTETAGDAALPILAQIDRFETALQTGDAAEANAAQETIDRILTGQPVKISDREETISLFGQARAVIDEAHQYRLSEANRAQGELSLLLAIRKGYRTNPQLVLTREWSEAVRQFVTRDSVQVQLMSPTLERLVVSISRDPNIARLIEQARLLKENEDYEKKRRDQMERERFNKSRSAGGSAMETQ